MLIRIAFLLIPQLGKQVENLLNAAIELERQECARIARNEKLWTVFGEFDSYYGNEIANKITARNDRYGYPKQTFKQWIVEYKLKVMATLNPIALGLVLVIDDVFEGW